MEESWNSFDAVMLAEESELISQLLGAYPFSIEQGHHVDNSYRTFQDVDSSSCFLDLPSEDQAYYFRESNLVPSISTMVDPNSFGESIGFLNNDDLVEFDEPTEGDQKFDNAENPKKKAKTMIKVQKSIRTDNEDKNNVALNLSGKRRASRGSATGPQSLYARKRRERINERLRILQSLVPNGTKVDISTMLEEAAEYVKFLQLQIKLLSSDEMWMYAPLAYNGMGLGLDLKISPPKQ